MVDAVRSLTADSLVDLATSNGFPITRGQLADWHRAGLLPRPEVRSKGKKHGSESVYLPGTDQQLLALCLIRRHERRYSYVAWHLWWSGYDVDRRHIDWFLDQVREALERIHAWAYDPATEELSDDVGDFLNAATHTRTDSKVLRQIRKRMGRERFKVFLKTLIELAAGTFDSYLRDPQTGWVDRHQQRGVEQGLQLDRARVDRVGAAGPWLDQDSDRPLQVLSRAVASARVTANQSELTAGRDELRLLLPMLSDVGIGFESALGRRAFGLTGIGRTVSELDEFGLALVLLAWLELRNRREVSGGLDALRQVETQRLRDAAILLKQLQTEVPAMAEALAPNKILAALRDVAQMQRLTAELAGIAEQHRKEIEEFNSRHPEVERIASTSA